MGMDKKWVKLAGFGIIVIAIIIAGLLVTTSKRTEPVETQSDIRNISVSVPEPPEISRGDQSMAISYTLETSRFEDTKLSLTKIEVLNTDTKEILESIEKESLLEHYIPGDPNHNPTINMTLQMNPDDVPKEITHRLYFISNGRAILPFSVFGGDIRLES